MYIVNESIMSTTPQKVKKMKDRIRFEACLQDANLINRNKRYYDRSTLEEGVARISDKIKSKTCFGELDHPINSEPTRQMTVLFHEISHLVCETSWDGNRLIGVLETLRTPNGMILKNLAEDGVPVGFSMRGMGDLRPVTHGTDSYMQVVGPLRIVSWDAVSFPSHSAATITKITESVQQDMVKTISEAAVYELDQITEDFGYVRTPDAIYYLPNDFDKLVQQRVIKLINKYEV